jgi:Short C-terminal domain
MTRQDNAHIKTFRQEKLLPGETLVGHLDGWIGEKMGQGERVRHNGQFVLTNERACFYRRDPFEEIFETIPLSKISSVETLSLMGYRVLRLHTAHDDLEFRTHEPKALFNEVFAQLERLRNEPTDHSAASTASAETITDQIKKLGELRDDGLLTEDEFNTKKAELLARL